MEIDPANDVDRNIAFDLFLRAKENPNRIGVIFEDGESLTFAEWEVRAAKCASILLNDLGLKNGDRVALYLQNSIDLVCLLFGCWKAGIVPVTLSVMYNADELASALEKTAPKAIFVHAKQIETVVQGLAAIKLANTLRVAVINSDPSQNHDDDFFAFSEAMKTAEMFSELVIPNEEDEGTILFTGGTTGLPKAVTVTHSGTRQSLKTLARASKRGAEPPYPLVDDDVSPNLLTLPLFHSGGQQALLFALFVGRSIVLMERFKVDVLEKLVSKYQIDNLFLMPTMLYDIVHSKIRIPLDSVKGVLIAGQALDPGLKQQFESTWNIPIFSNYGSTEIGHVAGWTSSDLKAGRWKAGPVGRVYDDVSIEIRDENGNVLPTGSEGEIWVKANLSKGYIDETSSGDGPLIIDGWVGSGDVGYLEGDQLLYLVGRKRDMIKTGGFQVWPQEIENVLRTHNAVLDVAIVGVADPRLGEIPKAFVVLADKSAFDLLTLENELIAFCREKLAHFKCIREVEFIDELPRSEAGKVQRGELAERSTKINHRRTL
jgi:long-chain acyl-CoA synthetase